VSVSPPHAHASPINLSPQQNFSPQKFSALYPEVAPVYIPADVPLPSDSVMSTLEHYTSAFGAAELQAHTEEVSEEPSPYYSRSISERLAGRSELMSEMAVSLKQERHLEELVPQAVQSSPVKAPSTSPIESATHSELKAKLEDMKEANARLSSEPLVEHSKPNAAALAAMGRGVSGIDVQKHSLSPVKEEASPPKKTANIMVINSAPVREPIPLRAAMLERLSALGETRKGPENKEEVDRNSSKMARLSKLQNRVSTFSGAPPPPPSSSLPEKMALAHPASPVNVSMPPAPVSYVSPAKTPPVVHASPDRAVPSVLYGSPDRAARIAAMTEHVRREKEAARGSPMSRHGGVPYSVEEVKQMLPKSPAPPARQFSPSQVRSSPERAARVAAMTEQIKVERLQASESRGRSPSTGSCTSLQESPPKVQKSPAKPPRSPPKSPAKQRGLLEQANIPGKSAKAAWDALELAKSQAAIKRGASTASVPPQHPVKSSTPPQRKVSTSVPPSTGHPSESMEERLQRMESAMEERYGAEESMEEKLAVQEEEKMTPEKVLAQDMFGRRNDEPALETPIADVIDSVAEDSTTVERGHDHERLRAEEFDRRAVLFEETREIFVRCIPEMDLTFRALDQEGNGVASLSEVKGALYTLLGLDHVHMLALFDTEETGTKGVLYLDWIALFSRHGEEAQELDLNQIQQLYDDYLLELPSVCVADVSKGSLQTILDSPTTTLGDSQYSYASSELSLSPSDTSSLHQAQMETDGLLTSREEQVNASHRTVSPFKAVASLQESLYQERNSHIERKLSEPVEVHEAHFCQKQKGALRMALRVVEKLNDTIITRLIHSFQDRVVRARGLSRDKHWKVETDRLRDELADSAEEILLMKDITDAAAQEALYDKRVAYLEKIKAAFMLHRLAAMSSWRVNMAGAKASNSQYSSQSAHASLRSQVNDSQVTWGLKALRVAMLESRLEKMSQERRKGLLSVWLYRSRAERYAASLMAVEEQFMAQEAHAGDQSGQVEALMAELAATKAMLSEAEAAKAYMEGASQAFGEQMGMKVGEIEELKAKMVQEKERGDRVEQELQTRDNMLTEERGEAGQEVKALQDELTVAWGETRRAQGELDERREEVSLLKTKLTQQAAAITRSEDRLSHTLGSIERNRHRRMLRSALRCVMNKAHGYGLDERARRAGGHRMRCGAMHLMQRWKQVVHEVKLARADETDYKNDAAKALFQQRSAYSVARQRRKRILNDALSLWSKYVVTAKAPIGYSHVQVGLRILSQHITAEKRSHMKECVGLWRLSMLDYTAMDVCNSAVECAIKGLTGNIRFAAASAVKRSHNSRDLTQTIIGATRALLTWHFNLAADPLPVKKEIVSSKGPRRSAARGIVSAKENSVMASVSPTVPPQNQRDQSPAKRGVLTDSTKERHNSISPNKISWRDELGMVKQRMAKMQQRHDQGYENAFAPKPLITDNIHDVTAVSGMHLAGCTIIDRILKQHSRFVSMRTFHEWTAYTRLQKLQRQKGPPAPRFVVNKSDFEKMQTENRMLMDKLAGAEEVNRAQRTANEALRRRAGGARPKSAR